MNAFWMYQTAFALQLLAVALFMGYAVKPLRNFSVARLTAVIEQLAAAALDTRKQPSLAAAIARNLQKKFNAAGLKITIEQWSVLYHLWKEDGKSQQELCIATFRDKRPAAVLCTPPEML